MAMAMKPARPSSGFRIPTAPVDANAEHYTQLFESTLQFNLQRRGYSNGGDVGEDEWAALVSDSIVLCVKESILKRVYAEICWDHFSKTRLEALHALIDIAEAMARAPGGRVSTLIQSGGAPGFLIGSMYTILGTADDIKALTLVARSDLLRKVKQLRLASEIVWTASSRRDIESMLQLLEDPIAVGFGQCCQEVASWLEALRDRFPAPVLRKHPLFQAEHHACGQVRDMIIRLVQQHILSQVRAHFHLETKLNALTALVDIGSLLVEGPATLFSDPTRGVMVLEYLCGAIYQIVGATMTPVELDQIFAQKGEQSEVATPPWYAGNQIMVQNSEFNRIWVQDAPRSRETKQCLLGKIVAWRASSPERWTWNAWDTMDDVIDLFFDGSKPLMFNQLLSVVTNALVFHKDTHWLPDGHVTYSAIPVLIMRSVVRLSRKVNNHSCFETKVSGFKTLTDMASAIVTRLKDRPRDKILEPLRWASAEEMLTSAMLEIYRSLKSNRSDWDAFRADKLLEIQLVHLNYRRDPSILPELDKIVRCIYGPGNSSVPIAVNKAGVIDLTKGPQVIDFIDLSED